MKKPVIGITPGWNQDKMSYDLPPAYMNAVLESGGLPLILPFTSDKDVIKQIVDMCDGFIFTGGHDVAPWVYGADPWYCLHTLAPLRDKFEYEFFPQVQKCEKPVLGICRGMQFINSMLGGMLYQDLPSQYEKLKDIDHDQEENNLRPIHKVKLVKDSPLAKITGRSELEVNSFHHQAVKTIGRGLETMAESPDGLVEALWAPNHPYMILLQWHPEALFPTDESSRKIFADFIEACSK